MSKCIFSMEKGTHIKNQKSNPIHGATEPKTNNKCKQCNAFCCVELYFYDYD